MCFLYHMWARGPMCGCDYLCLGCFWGEVRILGQAHTVFAPRSTLFGLAQRPLTPKRGVQWTSSSYMQHKREKTWRLPPKKLSEQKFSRMPLIGYWPVIKTGIVLVGCITIFLPITSFPHLIGWICNDICQYIEGMSCVKNEKM